MSYLTVDELVEADELKTFLLKLGNNSENFNQAINEILKNAVHKNRLDIVQMLIEHFQPTDFENADRSGLSLFMMAVINGNKSIMDLLLKQGANLNHYDEAGFNALYHAMRKKDLETSKWLVDVGCNEEFSIKDSGGEYHTPTLLAIANYRISKEEVIVLDEEIKENNHEQQKLLF